MLHPAAFTSTFLSTPSARRATYVDVAEAFDTVFLTTPSARRATALDAESFASLQEISIHALREEGD